MSDMMKRLFKFEIYKILRKPSFYTCLAVCALLFVLEATSAASLYGYYHITCVDLFEGIHFEGVMTTALTLGVFTLLYFRDDGKGAIKHVIGWGYTRMQYLCCKTVCATAIYTAYTLLSAIVSLIIAIIVTGGFGGMSLMHLLVFLLNWLWGVMMLAFAALLASLFKRTGAAMSLFFVIPFVGVTVFALIDLFVFLFSSMFVVTEYWFSLLYFSTVQSVSALEAVRMLLTTLVYLTGFAGGTWLLLRRREY